MNRFLLVLTLCAVATPATASESFYRLFSIDRRSVDPRALEAAKKVSGACNYSMLSRIGPRPEDAARCNEAEKKLVALGPSAIRAALFTIDEDDHGFGSGGKFRLYDIVARSGDLGIVDTLIGGLEREEKAGIGNARQNDRTLIASTLTALTYAEPKGTPAIEWRAWFDTHRGHAREQLLAERATEVEGMVGSAELSDVYESASFLAQQPATRERARGVLTSLLARTDLRFDQRRAIKRTLDRIPAPPAGVVQAVQGPRG